MEYSIITCTDGDNTVRAEHIQSKESAFQQFHYWCQLIYNDKNVKKGMVKVLDENLDCVEGKMEFITHEPIVETPSEPQETPSEE